MARNKWSDDQRGCKKREKILTTLFDGEKVSIPEMSVTVSHGTEKLLTMNACWSNNAQRG